MATLGQLGVIYIMHKLIVAGIAISTLAACGASIKEEGSGGGSGTGTGEIGTGGAGSAIARYEERTTDGNGYAESISYNSTNDTFTVDNLPFDGDNTYARDNVVASLGPFSVYENDSTYTDGVTGALINQFEHKAIRAVSTSGNVGFSIVRTGAYVNYGFGGFLYQREAGVTLPTTGQAHYTGDYAGLRDFKGRGGLEYVVGLMTVDIDFEDFDAGDAITGSITNRQILDTNGTNVTAGVLAALTAEQGVGITSLPFLNFVIEPGVLKSNGEIAGSINSFIANSDGAVDQLESGKYYAVIAGDNANEIAGVIVVESTDHRYEGVTVRETGGFILHHP